MVYLKQVSPLAKDVQALIEMLDQHNLQHYSAEVCYLDPPEILAAGNCRMFGAYQDSQLCGIGAIKLFGEYGEIKRMFVLPKFRGQGLSRMILDKLIEVAKASGCSSVKLETGAKFEAAVRLYQSYGFQECGPFGTYTKGFPNMYMERALT